MAPTHTLEEGNAEIKILVPTFLKNESIICLKWRKNKRRDLFGCISRARIHASFENRDVVSIWANLQTLVSMDSRKQFSFGVYLKNVRMNISIIQSSVSCQEFCA